jgi:hypothetical protein
MKRTLKRESKVLEIAGIEGMATSVECVVLVLLCGRVQVPGCNSSPCGSLLPRTLRSSCGSCQRGVSQDGFARDDNGHAEGGCRGNSADLIAAGRWFRVDRGAETGTPWAAWAMRMVDWRRDIALGVGAGVCRAPACSTSARLGILTKWLLFTRLETRTKESYMYASDRVENLFAE